MKKMLKKYKMARMQKMKMYQRIIKKKNNKNKARKKIKQKKASFYKKKLLKIRKLCLKTS